MGEAMYLSDLTQITSSAMEGNEGSEPSRTFREGSAKVPTQCYYPPRLFTRVRRLITFNGKFAST